MVKALICGGGNGAHVLAGIAASQPNTEARVLTLYADEAERWTNAMKGSDFAVSIHEHGNITKIVAKPSIVTKNPAEAAPGCDIIILTVPAFAHEQYLTSLKPHLQPGMVIVGLPGQAGFEFAVRGILGDLAKQITLVSFESLPWACRITEFGKHVDVLGLKDNLLGSVQMGSTPPSGDPIAMVQGLHGKLPKFVNQGHLLGITLMAVNGYLHPAIMYSRWNNWDGKPLDENPLFYNGLDQAAANLLSDVSDEIVAIAKGIMQQRPQVDLTNVQHLYQWYLRCYPDDIADKANLFTVLQTNRGYKGLTHPTEKTPDGKFVPNFKYRYLTEDIPYGLLVVKDVAATANVPTPNIDKMLLWAQKVMGKEYLVDGEVKGKDVKETRCAKRYGLTTLDQILGL